MVSTITATLGGKPVTIHSGRDADPHSHPLPLGLLGLDVETTYMGDRAQFDPDFRVRTVQLATADEAWIFDLADPHHRERVIDYLYAPQRSYCSHTNMDVLAIHREFGIDLSDRNIDTRGLAIEVDPDKLADRDLKSLATAYGMPELEQAERNLHAVFRLMWKDNGGKLNVKRALIEEWGWANIDVTSAVFSEYAALDALACRRLVDLLVPATGNPAPVLKTDQWLHAAANRIQIRGHRVDEPRLATMLEETKSIVNETTSAALEVTGDVKLNSVKLVGWLAEHGADWNTWEARTETGAPSLAKVTAAQLDTLDLDEPGRGVADLLLVYKKVLDAYNKCRAIEARLVDGRIHPLLNPVGATTTARMSSAGPNMQNFSKKNPAHRGLFIPDEGHGLATIDFAQIELRVVAALAREEAMIETILAGGDLHQLTVDRLADMGMTVSRQTAKHGNFLIVYGGGPKALVDQTRAHGEPIDLDTASSVVYGIRDAYPRVQALTEYMGMQTEEVRTISNRRLPVTKGKDGRPRTYANINYLVQSSARELLADCWMRLESRHPGVVWWPIHDELVLTAPVDRLREVMADAEKAMRFDFRGVPIEADAIELLDEHGDYRWMPGDVAERIAKEKVDV